ncbi:MAG: class I SAM-dependent methyltransferase [Candidatus Delongbacteria bacterium]|nr:class I SAM-dependent methyltransferase [Candidatus Delongbacteria bacterium]
MSRMMTKELKTHYIGHDGAYRYRKAKGEPGWASEEDNLKFEKVIEDSLKTACVPKGGKVLELGCGAGDMSLVLVAKGYEAYGIDISPTAIEWAKEKASERNLKADFRVGSVLDLCDFPDNHFDYILDGHCLHCIIGKDREKFLSEAFRVLKPGGIFFSETMCGEIRDPEVLKLFDPESRCMIRDGVAGRYIGLPEDIVEELKSAGFNLISYEVSPDPDAQDDLRIIATKNNLRRLT